MSHLYGTYAELMSELEENNLSKEWNDMDYSSRYFILSKYGIGKSYSFYSYYSLTDGIKELIRKDIMERLVIIM